MRAMHEAAAEKDPFQLAVVDYQMPEMDGMMFGRAVKNDAALKNTVLVMLSSVGQRHLTPEIREAGFSACLSKAVYASQLIQTIADAWRSISKGTDVPVKPRPPLPVIRARVLVAEDNVANQKVATRLLEKLGCRVDVAATGADVVVSANPGCLLQLEWGAKRTGLDVKVKHIAQVVLETMERQDEG